jgi:hypothetical protein
VQNGAHRFEELDELSEFGCFGDKPDGEQRDNAKESRDGKLIAGGADTVLSRGRGGGEADETAPEHITNGNTTPISSQASAAASQTRRTYLQALSVHQLLVLVCTEGGKQVGNACSQERDHREVQLQERIMMGVNRSKAR